MSLYDENNDDIKELLNNIVRIGKVSSVDCERGTARVIFTDDDGIVSYDLPVLHRNAIKNKDYNMPDIDERVLCLFLPSGVASGFILGSVYTDTVTPPESTGDKRTVVFGDGARFSYDRETHQFDAQIDKTTIKANRENVEIDTPQDVKVTAANNVEVTAKKDVKVTAGNNVEVTATKDVKVTAANNVEVTATNAVNVTGVNVNVNAVAAYVLNTATATVNAPVIALNGNVSVAGTLVATADVVANGISLNGHTHTGNMGQPTSPPTK